MTEKQIAKMLREKAKVKKEEHYKPHFSNISRSQVDLKTMSFVTKVKRVPKVGDIVEIADLTTQNVALYVCYRWHKGDADLIRYEYVVV